MEKHKFWGEVAEDWAGFSAEETFSIPHFEQTVTVFLGEEFDEDGEEIDTPPTAEELNAYELTFSSFLEHLDSIITEVKEQAFNRYQKLYAHYFEDEAKSGEPPLNLNTPGKHFQHLKEINYIRVLGDHTLQIAIRYGVDTEHGLEIRLENNKIVAMAGIAET
ncbi:hypothetical protein DBR43_07055 [Pedobacter sp. KBW06]|uniref:DUF6985 domain-containing protein n=1 Tax=Pedobacter sp. KBW06 TaxID=2153359 RepID=UPI000F5ACE7C|nr:hypothetical protein [Pedobacter sp. KBW06]RQO75122.1 hypothetical protein DBR43_07055 [Pedobacter sp. KBW06]